MRTTSRSRRHAWGRSAAIVAFAGVFMAGAPAWARRGPPAEPASAASTAAPIDIRRTADGIPHVRAYSWRALGIGYGYAQAEDALCTLADQFVTFRGERSLRFGPDEKPPTRSTFGQPKNIDLDFFFKAFADADAVEAFRREQPAELNELIAGYAEGYSRYVRTLAPQAQRGGKARAQHACAGAPWVGAIEPDDIYRRMIAAGLAGGYARFVSEIVNAQPAATTAAASPAPAGQRSLQSRLDIPVGDVRGIGSNVLAFGQAAAGERGGSVLFGNPHWYWGGPDRFYQVHLTLPGKLDVAGVSFLGIPLVMIGFNNDVAWSHTVSSARRFGLFQLALDAKDPTRYIVDGVSEPMRRVPLAVQVRRADGTTDTVRRTLYRTRFGPVVDLGAQNEALGWSAGTALAMRDVNAGNHRIFRNFFRWDQARSLDDFIEIQRQEAAVPWVTTTAIGRGDGRAWFSEVGAVPNVPDDLREACATPISKAFAAIDPGTPFLDGSRSACEWKADATAVQRGAMPAAQMPGLLREDYVANMNGSYWLANPAQPLTGFASILGGEGQPLTLRGREGHRIAAELAGAGASSADALAQRVMRTTLEARAYSADQYKKPLLDRACVPGRVEFKPDAQARARTVDVRRACQVLRNWPNRADAGDRGALLWDAFWTRLQQIPEAELYAKAFSADAPLRTPAQVNAADPRVAQALAGAADDMRRRGWALDAPLGSKRFARSAGREVALFGGCDTEGYFAVSCSAEGDYGGDYTMGPTSHGNSYLQVVWFDRRGVHARTLLAHGETDTAVAGGRGAAPVARYARKAWLRFPFREEDIARDPSLVRQTLRP
ncbi:penicillin acylase family protein [Variovorax sp. 770b2]|uniref:penicillin acylase family protein n=1 Tax=Variovorax sp. 770b2 TaxID=1566271 RepID=UPI00210E60A3|nr:penicillin acylase family protein [Variovorax sp. 770b2]